MTYSEFLTLLAANNNRPWFQQHKAIYEQVRERWYEDLDRLFAAMSEWEPAARYLTGREASYRIYRDTRFSPDKTPYKKYFSAEVSYGGKRIHSAGWYIQAGAVRADTGLFGGIWAPDSAELRKLRHAIVDNIEEFEQIINAPEMLRLYPGWWGPTLKTIPKGWPKDHPQAPLLRLLHYGKELELEPSFFDDPQWPVRAVELMRPLKPLNDFINYSLFEE